MFNNRYLKPTSWFIKVASFSCVIHCIAAPIIILSAPFLGFIFDYHWLEWILLGLSICCGTYIVVSGFCVHQRYLAISLYVFGSLLWIAHLLLENSIRINSNYILIRNSIVITNNYFFYFYIF